MTIAKRLFRSFEGSSESSWIRLGLAVAAMTAYILAFIPPFTPEEYRVAELAATPVVVCAWLFGFWGGTAAAILVIPFNAYLLSLVAGGTFGTVLSQLREEELLPTVLLLVLGAVLGGLRDVAAQTRRERLARRKVEEARRASEERYRFLVETTSDGVLTIDQDRTILSANRAAENIFGRSAVDMVGKPFQTLIPERVREGHDAALRQYLEVVGTGHAEYAIQIAGLGRGDREIALEISFGDHASDGRHMFTGVVRDVTGRKQREHVLMHAREQAERGGRSGGNVPSSAGGPGEPAPPAQKRVVLFIADEPLSLTAVEDSLGSRPDVELLTARQGQHGLELARERAPHLILLDLNLPDMHGSEVMRRIRDDSLLSRTPVIIVGAEGPHDQAARLLEAGAQACMVRPLDPAELLRVVDQTLTS